MPPIVQPLILLLSLWIGSAWVSMVCAQDAAARPNIVVFLCDDLGYGDLACYGHPHIRTPHLDQLAREGIRFTDFYSAAPVCSPSRVGLLTGRNPNRAGIYDWIPASDGTPRPNAREQVHMRSGEVTIARMLQGAGYATFMAGKWHCNSRFNQPALQPLPSDFGFDHWLATDNNARPSHDNPANFVRNGVTVGEIGAFSCQYVVTEAIQWLQDLRETDINAAEIRGLDKPFFLFIPFHEPHEPVASPRTLVDQYRNVATSLDEAHYFANVTNIDLAVGRLLQALDDMDAAEDTLVIFTSDNGPETLNRYRTANRSFGSPGDLRGMKLHTHEGGVRVAGIVRWPAQIAAGQKISTPVWSLDLFPTFCDIAECRLPNRELDGRNILPVLQGQPFARDKPLVWCYFNATNEARMAMRDGDWKVLARLTDASGEVPKKQNITPVQLQQLKNASLTDVEIYNLVNDHAEQQNLAADRPQLAGEMLDKLQQQFNELLDDSPVWQPDIDD